MIAPLGIVSIYFVIIQPVVIGTWSTLALIGAGAVLIACSVICFAAPALAALVPSSRDFGTPQEA